MFSNPNPTPWRRRRSHHRADQAAQDGAQVVPAVEAELHLGEIAVGVLGELHRVVGAAQRGLDVADERVDAAELLQLDAGLAAAVLSRLRLSALHPGALASARQLKQDHDFEDIRLVLPTTVFDEQHMLDLDGTEVRLIYVGPCHQIGDTIVHVPEEKVVFAGDVIFRECTPMGWNGGTREGLRRGPGRGPCQGHRGRVLTRLTKSMSLAMKLISGRPAAGRCGRRSRDSMARSWRGGASRADVSFFKWRYQ